MTQSLPHTPSQTVGPFFHIALADPAARFAVEPGSPGAIVVSGVLTDGAGDPIPDGLIETWQADGLFARCPTDRDGRFEIHTRKPPPAATVDGRQQAPHLSVSVFSRGLLDRVVTRIYFADEQAANDADPTLAAVAPELRDRLIAEAESDGSYRFDIQLQGERESVFLEI